MPSLLGFARIFTFRYYRAVLQRRASDRAVAELQEIGRRTLLSLKDEHGPLSRLMQARQEFTATLRDLVSRVKDLSYRLDPERLDEQQFVDVTTGLAEVIDALESHFVHEVDSTDVAQCQIVGDAIRELRDVNHWLVQGLSPDPSKRPTDRELAQRMRERAAAAFEHLAADR